MDRQSLQRKSKAQPLSATHSLDGPDFDSVFPKLSHTIAHFEEITNIEEAKNHLADKSIPKNERRDQFFCYLGNFKRKIFPLINDELGTILPEWTELLPIHDSLVCMHTLSVMYLITHDDDFKYFTKKE